MDRLLRDPDDREAKRPRDGDALPCPYPDVDHDIGRCLGSPRQRADDSGHSREVRGLRAHPFEQRGQLGGSFIRRVANERGDTSELVGAGRVALDEIREQPDDREARPE